LKGTLDGAHGELISRNKFTGKNLNGIEFYYTAEIPEDKKKKENISVSPVHRYKRMMLIKNFLIMLDYWTDDPENKKVIDNREKFFSSLTPYK
jgi:hypothetical protein